MSSLEEALAFDRAGDIVHAAEAYEKAVKEDADNAEALINLAVLYWQATDFGFSAGNQLSVDFVSRAGKRFPEILAEAAIRHPNMTEPFFWKRYIAWADLGEDLHTSECEELLRRAPNSLEPVVFLIAQEGGVRYRTEAERLLDQAKRDGTTRSRYVSSVLESALKRAAR